MSIPILHKGGKDIVLNALFFQPTRWCGLNCKGCYVKAHEGGEDGPHLSWDNWRHLFHLFYNGPHWANQITISVDDLPKEADKRKHMLLVVDSILEIMALSHHSKGPDIDRPEVHMTMHTPRTWLKYNMEMIEGWERLSTVSFSTLPLHPLYPTKQVINTFRHWKVPINFNHTVPLQWDAGEERQMIEERAALVDHIHIVMYKDPVGSPNIYKIEKGREIWALYKLYIEQVVDKLSGDVRRKVSTDSCVSDTIKHSRTGFGCSANISRIQVWPDGSVSGCPYAFSGTGPGANHAEGVLENIRSARQRYDFRERCHLPDVYSPFSGRQGLRVFQIS